MAIGDLLAGANLHVTVSSGEALDVREFLVDEGLSRPFEVRLIVTSPNPDVDFEAAIGRPARFELRRGGGLVAGAPRAWGGICASFELLQVEEDGVSTYALRIVPELWLLTQRRTYRVFQDKSELDVALEVLRGWGIEPTLELDAASYPKRRIRVQYAETDFAFVSRLLEDIGVTYHFAEAEGSSTLVLVDAPSGRAPSASVPFIAQPGNRVSRDYVTQVRTQRVVRPGRYTQSDVDYRKALDYPLSASQSQGQGIERELERYHHVYGGFLWKSEAAGDTPVADDRGPARTDEAAGSRQVQRRLEAQRVEARACTLKSTAYELQPGMVVTITGHPRAELAAPLLVETGHFEGTATGDWYHRCALRFVDVAFRPAMATPRPRTMGVESATVTGPPGEEIHTDEFGRVRVRFHWDRDGAPDHTSSCWIPVSQPWAGAGFGALNLPRVGQEVIVDFMGADPDRPVVLGRVFTKTTPPPYELPKFKMVSGLRSESYPRKKPAAAGARMGGGPAPDAPVASADVGVSPASPASPATDGAAAARRAAARPVGGGLGLEALGGTEVAPGGQATVAGMQTQAQPGIFGGVPALREEFDQAMGRMQSLGPDGADHTRSANGLVFEDSSGAERVYLQGERDLFMSVKNNLTGTIGANRAFSVTGNDYEEINCFQATKVNESRTVEISKIQAHQVGEDIFVSGGMSYLKTIQKDISTASITGGQVHQAKLGILFRVDGKSAILMTPDAILIDAQKVYINPGPEVMEAVYGGQSPEEAIAEQASRDRVNAAFEAMMNWESHMQEQFPGTSREAQFYQAGRGENMAVRDVGRNAAPGITEDELSRASYRVWNHLYH